jgi:DNA polymerase-3 subunit gamma/tau
MLTGEASNALLKTLEEPPDRVIFVMATTEPENLVDTIRSRSQHFHFRALTFNEITSRLKFIAQQENLKIEDGALSVLARMAEGSMRDALSLLEQARAYCGDDIRDKGVRELLGVVPEDALNELVQAIAEQSAERALGLVHTFQKEGRNLQHFCREAIRHMRNLLIARVCGADSDLVAATPDQRPGLAKAAELFSEEDLTRFFQILLQTDDDLRRKPDPRVHLEMGLLRLVNAARLAPLEELLAEARTATGGGGPNGGGSAPRTSTPSASKPTPTVRTASAFSSAPEVTSKATLPAASVPSQDVDSRVSARRTTSLPSTTPVEAAQTRVAAASTMGNNSNNSTSSASAAAPAIESKTISVNDTKAEAMPQAKKTEVAGTGITGEQIAQVKAAIQGQQKFIGELLEHASRWELDGSELRIYFPSEKSTFAGLIEGRETLEKIRAVSGKVLARAVRVCAKLETGAANAENGARGASSTQEMRAQFENNPMVKSMLQRFGGRISEVRRQSEE